MKSVIDRYIEAQKNGNSKEVSKLRPAAQRRTEFLARKANSGVTFTDSELHELNRARKAGL